MLLITLLTGFYVAGEFALLTADRSRIEQLSEAGDTRATSALQGLRTLSFQLSGAQLGITVTSLLVGFISEPTIGEALAPLIGDIWPSVSALAVANVVALLLATIIQMVVGELIPKNYAIARPTELALLIATPFRFANSLFRPIIKFLNAAADWTVRLFGIQPREELQGVRSLQELKRLIYSSREGGVLPQEEFALLARSITFGDKTADDALIPRVSVVALKKDETIRGMRSIALASGHSRFPVCGDDLDDIAGVAHVKDAYRIPVEERDRAPVTSIMQEPLFAPESRPLNALLAEMRRERKHLAVILDEYGGTAGILTLEDLLEEIVGEIEDEHDPRPPLPITSPPEGIALVSGGLHPDELLEATGLEIPDGDYETLAGFLLSLFKRIPRQGDQVDYEGWEFKVIEMDRHRIVQVLIAAPASSIPSEEVQR